MGVARFRGARALRSAPMPESHDVVLAAHQLGEAVLRFLTALEDRAAEQVRRNRLPPEPKRPKPEPVLLNSREAAALLSISKGTLFNHSAPRGPIKTVRIGASVRYARDDLLAFAE